MSLLASLAILALRPREHFPCRVREPRRRVHFLLKRGGEVQSRIGDSNPLIRNINSGKKYPQLVKFLEREISSRKSKE